MNAMSCISVLLADDHTIVREGLRKLLEAESDIEVVGEAANGGKVVELAQKLRPDVIVMDIAMPQLNGLEATRQICRAVPGAKVLILSAHNDDVYVDNVMASGAVGYLIKQTSAHLLSVAIREVQKGNRYFSPEITKRNSKRKQDLLSRTGVFKARSACLSSREIEVLQLIAEGNANKQIAEKLGISIKTVEKHRDHLMRKLDIHDTAGLTRYAIETGIIECGIRLTIV